MKIKKISISNFKNIKNEIIVDFEKEVSLLVGPNGFGKTTIFDAIELALTGTIYRIANSRITDGRSTFNKAYFQNNTNKDVIIKLLICNQKGEQLTIVRWYKNNLSGRDRKMSPANSLDQFQLLVGDESNFASSSALSDMKISKQEMIDDFIGFRSNSYKIQEIYNLFNYIQQEDTDYYLRRSENSRKTTLNFLLQIQDYQNKKLKIGSIESDFNRIEQTLTDQEKIFRQNHILDTVNFEKLPFMSKREHKLNHEEIEFGQNLSEDSLQKYMNELDRLIDFREKFSPDEYFKKQQKNKFAKEILNNEELQNYIIFRGLVKNDQTIKLIVNNHNLLNDSNNYSSYLLENFIDKIDFLEKQIATKDNLNQFKRYINSEIDEISIDNLSVMFEKEDSFKIIREIFTLFKLNLESFLEKNKELLDIKNDYSEVNALRNKLKEYSLPKNKEDSQCVLCGYDWKSKSLLQEQYNIVDRILDKNMTTIQKDVSDLRLKIDGNIKELREGLSKIEEKLIIVSPSFINEIKMIKVSDKISSFKKVVTSNTDIKPFEFKALDLQTYIQVKEKMENILSEQLLVSNEIYDLFSFSGKNKEYFDAVLVEYPSIGNDLLMSHEITNKMLPLSLNAFNSKKEKIKSELDDIFVNINYDFLKSNDPSNIFDDYFDKQKEAFILCSEEKMITKKKYIQFKFEEKRSIKLEEIKSRLSIVKRTHYYLKERSIKLDENIKEYQQRMIDILKLPFFLYTAKILQNYQQGMGVLLTTHDRNANIRFLTNSYSEQDAMYQLSSGQVAVISFAFTLSLNKTFKISEGLKILAIDDPIQDMDAMNVHALIDLLRHSLPDYQIIMSTHSDANAMFIKYKFDLMSNEKEEKVNLVNAKTLFLEKLV